jgi:hypothetical protein
LASQNDVAGTVLSNAARFGIILLVANNYVRHMNNGHDFISRDVNVAGTATLQAVKHAGQEMASFVRLCTASDNGHDLTHFITVSPCGSCGSSQLHLALAS